VKQFTSYHYPDFGSLAGLRRSPVHGESEWISPQSSVEVWRWLCLPERVVAGIVWQQVWFSSSSLVSDAICREEEQCLPGMWETWEPLGFSGF